MVAFVFKLPKRPGSLSFDWKFATEENPNLILDFLDIFQANVTTSTSTKNIARLPDGSEINDISAAPFSNAPTGTSENPSPPFPIPNDVTYNAVTSNVMTSSIDLSHFRCETITISFLIADGGDATFDSAVFLDNLKIDGCEGD
ncbi:choice-of-anchor L domain-containing protein [Cytobacillus sp. Hm23]